MRAKIGKFIVPMIVASLPILASGQNHRAAKITNPDIIEADSRSVPKSSRPDTVYDKVKNESTFFLSGVMVVAEGQGREVMVPGETQNRRLPSSILKLVTYYKAPGKKKALPNEVVIAFNYGNYAGFEFGEHRTLKIITDTETFDLGSMKMTEKKDEGFRDWGFLRYWETLELPINFEIYRKIVNAKSVAIQVGAGSASISSSQLKQLKGYLKELE